MKYENLEALVKAYQTVELTEASPMVVDNDTCTVYDDSGCVFRIHPYELMFELLAYVGIPAEPV